MSHPLRILCTGDLHLGRFPTRVPRSDRTVAVEHAWKSCVRLAIEEEVDVVCLTGDVVDNENAFFESYGPLHEGVSELADAGIQTLAVSGNHDFDVLRRLAGALPPEHFRFVGEGRQWEVVEIEIPGKPALAFVGWSFARRHETISPVPSLPDDLPRDRPLIGMLHCDLDAVRSRYLPVSRHELEATPVQTWLLGHIHKPDLHRLGPTQILYPGSPQPLNPRETGDHGPWLVTVAHGGAVTFEQRPIASLRYEDIKLDASTLDRLEALDSFILRGLQESVRSHADRLPTLKRVVARIALTGDTSLHRGLPDAVRRLNVEDIDILGSVNASIDRLVVETRPELDLEGLAHRRDPAGELAELVLAIRRGEDPGGVVDAAVKEINGIDTARPYLPLAESLEAERGEDPESAIRSEARKAVERQALLLLHQLADQIEET